MAEYWAQKLAEKGIDPGEMIAEDWGWYVRVNFDGTKLAVCCGHQNGDADEFLCFTDPSTPIRKTLFRKLDITAPLTKLTQAMHEILSSDPDVREVAWMEVGGGHTV